MTAEISEFKGHPVLTLKNGTDEKYPFSFGISKAKSILAHIKEIEQFVASQSNATPQDKTPVVKNLFD